jgi:hypothetical protein
MLAGEPDMSACCRPAWAPGEPDYNGDRNEDPHLER